jgi:hypothetical protein
MAEERKLDGRSVLEIHRTGATFTTDTLARFGWIAVVTLAGLEMPALWMLALADHLPRNMAAVIALDICSDLHGILQSRHPLRGAELCDVLHEFG